MVLAGLFYKELKCLRVVLATSARLARNFCAANVRLKTTPDRLNPLESFSLVKVFWGNEINHFEMRYPVFMVAFMTLLRAPVSSQPRGYAFDPKTGTEFRWYVDTTGNKHIATFNRTQRSLWNLTIDSLGNRSGTDENGDF